MSKKKKPYKHSPFDEEFFDAMVSFNKDKPTKEQFSLADARILSLIHSYDFTNTLFFASNNYLAEKVCATPATAQKSINKLYSYGLIDKKVHCVNGKKQRVLTYNESGVDAFKNNPKGAKKKEDA